MGTHVDVDFDSVPVRPNRTTLNDYKRTWANYTGRESQAEQYHRESAVTAAENQLHSEGQRYIDAERERLTGRAAALSQSYADIQAAARAITEACQSRIVDVEEVADQLDELEKQARANRAIIARIEQQQDVNEARAENPIGIAEALYAKYPMVPSPVDSLPGFRTDSEQSSPVTRPRLAGRTVEPGPRKRFK